MNQVHPRFIYQFLVSLNKFDSSMARVMEKTLASVNFDRSFSTTPTYIGIDVGYEPNHDLLKTIRRFFQRLRMVNQKHFVRFVVDTMWMMESDNGDVFLGHDQAKEERCDVIWSLKVVDHGQFELTILKTPDNRRREILTELQTQLTRKVYSTADDITPGEELQSVLHSFYMNTKNIQLMTELKEDCHVVLVPVIDNKSYMPVLITGLSVGDGKRRMDSIKRWLTWQNHAQAEYFPIAAGVGDLLQLPLDLIRDNGVYGEKGFSCESLYNAAEQAYAIYHTASSFSHTPNAIAIFHTHYNPFNIDSVRMSLDYLHNESNA